MRSVKYVRDPRAFEVIADETRRKIIYLLRAKEMTVSQLAESLNLTPQAIYHQVKKLLDVGLVEVAKEERVDHFIETYYRATAEVFEFQHGVADPAQAAKELAESLEALARVGVDVKVNAELVDKAYAIETRLENVGLRPDLEEKLAQLGDVGFITKQHAHKFAQLVTMSDKEFEAKMAGERKLRELLRSGLKGSAKDPTK